MIEMIKDIKGNFKIISVKPYDEENEENELFNNINNFNKFVF